ncbi:hypothetical protein DAEQUDRAFT_731508 [Daedalea quercina L-15889]|uniref:Uncharacterized protein n=1 Tax=Daedalea quercina L-15889 TaxID=1314783 RepID=A0A165M869_9APHY|nr:hypothetical protein DAEQUDRAFT_731508 [Daedalea quercina L-15889]
MGPPCTAPAIPATPATPESRPPLAHTPSSQRTEGHQHARTPREHQPGVSVRPTMRPYLQRSHAPSPTPHAFLEPNFDDESFLRAPHFRRPSSARPPALARRRTRAAPARFHSGRGSWESIEGASRQTGRTDDDRNTISSATAAQRGRTAAQPRSQLGARCIASHGHPPHTVA